MGLGELADTSRQLAGFGSRRSGLEDRRWKLEDGKKMADVRFQRSDASGRAEHVVGRDFSGSGICAVRDVGLRTVMKGENMATERRANNAFSVKIS